jgi:hypothetical protein|uniref:S-protein homolog n=1 Tax=Fagus sylvatica TaxID=28930 RepID=A0A2N9IMD1_FAGSY
MGDIRNKSFSILLLLLLLFGLSRFTVLGKVHVRIVNKLGSGRIMNVHYQSHDDDLGFHAIPDGLEMEWKFSVNIWSTTMFYCDVQWDNSNWHHFVAYSDSYEWDSNICQTECSWLISKEGQLFVYDQEFRNWDLIPFQD